MTCRGVRRRLSAYLEGDLAGKLARTVELHLLACGACAERRRSLERSLELLSDLPRLEAAGGIAPRVLALLELESRGPGLALLFRPAWAARPLFLPSLVPAALVLVAILAGALALDRDQGSGPTLARGQPAAWEPHLPAWGTEGNPLFPSSDVSVPRARGGAGLPDQLLTSMGEGTIFLETVVARDGSVSTLTLLDGDSAQARQLMDALRHERFEPARFHGRPVAVSVYRLISRMEVREPIT